MSGYDQFSDYNGETNACVLSGLFVRDSTERNLALCNAHSSILGLSKLQNVVENRLGKHTLTTMAYTRSENFRFPFPYRLVNPQNTVQINSQMFQQQDLNNYNPNFDNVVGVNVNRSDVFCIDYNLVQDILPSYVYSLNLLTNQTSRRYNDNDENEQLIERLQAILSEGTLLTSNLCVPYSIYSDFLKDKEGPIRQHFSNTYILAYSQRNQVMVPMSRLPVFYLCLLSSIEMSSHALMADPDVLLQNLVPNLRLNMDTHYLESINTDGEYLPALLKGEATITTPVILAGVRLHNSTIRLYYDRGMNLRRRRFPNICMLNRNTNE